MWIIFAYPIISGGVAAAVVLVLLVGIFFFVRRGNNRSSAAPRSSNQQRQNAPKLLLKWADETLQSDEVNTWLQAMNKRELRDLTDDLLAYGDQYGFNPTWVFDSSTEIDADLDTTLAASIEEWLHSRYVPAASQNKIQLFERYNFLVTQPEAPENHELTERLYARLVALENAPALPADLILSEDKKRRTHAIKSIEAAARSDWNLFAPLLAEELNVGAASNAGANRRRSRSAGRSRRGAVAAAGA